MEMLQKNPSNPMAAMMAMMMMNKMGSDTGATDDSNPKQLLIQAHSKASGQATKGAIKYETSQIESEDSKRPQYQSMVTVGGQQYAGECAASKKEAEQNAAKTALADAYPDAMTGSKKRKREDAGEKPAVCTKNKLLALIQHTKGAGVQLTKDDISTTFEEGTATVKIAVLNATFKGTGSNQKEAEAAALEKAIESPAIKKQLEAAEEEMATKKKALNVAKMEKFKEKHPDKFVKKAKTA